MFNWLLDTINSGVVSDIVNPDNKPDAYGSGTSDEMLIALFGILALIFLGLFIFFFIKYSIIKEKYQNLQIEEKQNNEECK